MSFGPSSGEWTSYKGAIDDFFNKVGKQSIVWHSVTNKLDRFGEDKITRTNITLQALVSYNAFRVWPINKAEEQGSPDLQYCHIYLNQKYLNDLGYLNSDGYFKLEPSLDRFTINGIKYRPSGDTQVSQKDDSPLYTIVILERDVVDTSDIQR